MPETTTTPTLPEWVRVGAKVASFSHTGLGRSSSATLHTIQKIGKRDIVLDNGDRFNTRRLERHVGGTWGYTYYLLPLDDPRVIEARAQARRYRTAGRVEALLREWRNSGNEETLRTILDALSAHLTK